MASSSRGSPRSALPLGSLSRHKPRLFSHPVIRGGGDNGWGLLLALAPITPQRRARLSIRGWRLSLYFERACHRYAPSQLRSHVGSTTRLAMCGASEEQYGNSLISPRRANPDVCEIRPELSAPRPSLRAVRRSCGLRSTGPFQRRVCPTLRSSRWALDASALGVSSRCRRSGDEQERTFRRIDASSAPVPIGIESRDVEGE